MTRLQDILRRPLTRYGPPGINGIMFIVTINSPAEEELFTDWLMVQINRELAEVEATDERPVPGGGEGHEGKDVDG